MMLFTVLKECVEKVLIPNVHQNLFSIISHPSLSCLAPSLSIAFHLHCSTPFASVEKRWVSLYSYRASCNLCSDISYFSGFFVSFVYRKRYCQNPNLTTTQPKPNLNLVGFDMIITLHHHHHHPTHQELYI